MIINATSLGLKKDDEIDLDFSKWPGETQHIAEQNSIKNSFPYPSSLRIFIVALF